MPTGWSSWNRDPSAAGATDFAGAHLPHQRHGRRRRQGAAAHLAQMAATLPANDERRLFRLGVDRVFTLAGQGTIVTGTALAGSVRVGDTLQLAPGGQQVRVRSIHAQNRAAEWARRPAAGAEPERRGKDDIARGTGWSRRRWPSVRSASMSN
jgi:selenocysteine-specific elongation factor